MLIKPDGIEKKVVGAVISRFEDAGFKIIGLKLVRPDKKLAEAHYPESDSWKVTWERTKKGYEDKGLEYSETLEQLTKRLRGGLIEYITDMPVIAIVLTGNDVIATVRKICGATSPDRADPTSIRGMYSKDSYEKADKEKRSVRNIMHASDSVETAEKEISLWFTKKELVDY